MRRMRALLVDDRPVLRETLIAALEELAPLDIVATSDSETKAMSFTTALAPPCDLVITDVPLAAGSGLGLLHQMRSRHTRCRAVVLTSKATPSIRAKALELGAERVFDVAREFEDLVEYVQGLVQREASDS